MDVIIVGAGAAGLMAAMQLSANGLQVLVLEARDRIGGRIHSLQIDDDLPVEGGAEFIHGNLGETFALLAEAQLQKQELKGDAWQVIQGNWNHENAFFENAELILAKLKQLNEDMTIADFLQLHFNGEQFRDLRAAFTGYIEGYYSGEISKASARSFLKEWESEDDQQYRPVGGYGKMIDYLAERARISGTNIRLSTVVKQIRWKRGEVEILDESMNRFTASKVLITVPLGIWTSGETARGAIVYAPALPEKTGAAKEMGFGSVIKVLLRFREAFWETDSVRNACGVNTAHFHMAISDQPVPTWWSQLPRHLPLLTGWLSGPKAAQMKDESESAILQIALRSVSEIFKIELALLQEKLVWSKVFNWTNDPFTLGSYSYSTIHTAWARKILTEPVEDTLFFAGEGLYDGPEMGTVEAALSSGRAIAETIRQVGAR